MNGRDTPRVIVVGAGIAGLACAYELQRAGCEVVVYEKEPRVGGRMASREKDGFVFDIGADHLCDLYDQMKSYCSDFGISWEPMRFLKYGIMKSGKVLSKEDVIGRVSKFRLALEYFRAKDVGYRRFIKTFAPGSLNNLGRRFGLELIADREFLKRIIRMRKRHVDASEMAR